MPLRHSYRRSRWRQKKRQKTVRGRKQDRAGAAGGQDYEVRYDFEQDRAAGVGGEESHQESRQRLQACGEGLRR